MSNFKTVDLHLAVFLKIKGIQLLGINPLDNYRSEFLFAPVSPDLLNEWLTTSALAPTRSVINEYRHLLRDVHTRAAEVLK